MGTVLGVNHILWVEVRSFKFLRDSKVYLLISLSKRHIWLLGRILLGLESGKIGRYLTNCLLVSFAAKVMDSRAVLFDVVINAKGGCDMLA